jgi:hypothetical protein
MPSSEFYTRLVEVSEAIGARPEDLLLCLAAETNFTLEPSSTRWARPNVKPKNWADLADICATPGTGNCGALGLNTILAETARHLSLSASEWWSLPDLSAVDNMFYVQLYFDWVRRALGLSGFVNALSCYIANAKYSVLANKLRPSTVVYDRAETAMNPGLDFNKDSIITVQDMGDTIVSVIWPRSQKFLNEYNQSDAGKDRVARLYQQTGQIANLYHPLGVGAPSPYAPTPTTQAIAEINAASGKDEETNWGLVGVGALAIVGIATAFALAISTTPGKRKKR